MAGGGTANSFGKIGLSQCCIRTTLLNHAPYPIYNRESNGCSDRNRAWLRHRCGLFMAKESLDSLGYFGRRFFVGLCYLFCMYTKARRVKMTELTEAEEQTARRPTLWDVGAWAFALGAFAVAMVLSYRKIQYNPPDDTRTPVVLLANALLATVVALGFALRDESFRWRDAHLCLRFGFWATAVFRLTPPILNETMLYSSHVETVDVQYVLLGALMHGGLAAFLAYPYGIRVLNLPEWTGGERLWEMCAVVVLLFFVVAVVVRLLGEHLL